MRDVLAMVFGIAVLLGWPLGMWRALVYLRRHPRRGHLGLGLSILRWFSLIVGGGMLLVWGSGASQYGIRIAFFSSRPSDVATFLLACVLSFYGWQLFQLGRRLRPVGDTSGDGDARRSDSSSKRFRREDEEKEPEVRNSEQCGDLNKIATETGSAFTWTDANASLAQYMRHLRPTLDHSFDVKIRQKEEQPQHRKHSQNARGLPKGFVEDAEGDAREAAALRCSNWGVFLWIFGGVLVAGLFFGVMSMEPNGGGSDGGDYTELSHSMQPVGVRPGWRRYEFREDGFSIDAPADWKPDVLEPGMVWHVGTDTEPLISVSVKVNTYSSIGVMGNDKYLESVTEDTFLKMVSVVYSKPEINHWQPHYPFAGGRALHVIYSGYIDDTKITVHAIQTIRNGKLYTLNCQTVSPSFHTLYSRTFVPVADTMSFGGRAQGASLLDALSKPPAVQPPGISQAQLDAVEREVRRLLPEQGPDAHVAGVAPTRLVSVARADGCLLVFLALGYEPARRDALEEYAREWQPIINDLVGEDWTDTTVAVACPGSGPDRFGLWGRLYPNGSWRFGSGWE